MNGQERMAVVKGPGTKVVILLPVHNRRTTTEKFIRQLNAQTYPDQHLVLIDDGSTDGTAAEVKAIYQHPVDVIQGNGRLWWGGALHQAYKWLGGNWPCNAADAVLIINDDVRLENDFIEKGLRILSENERSLLFAINHPLGDAGPIDKGFAIHWDKLDIRQRKTGEEVDSCSSRGLFMSMADFLRSGGFRPRLLPHYLSDIEFTYRLKKNGTRIVMDDRLSLYYDPALTGNTRLEAGSFLQYIRKCFSTKTDVNPLHWTAFVLLSCPAKYKILNILRIWYSFFRKGLKVALRER